MENLKQELSQMGRNKIVFFRGLPPGLHVVDVGKELSAVLMGGRSPSGYASACKRIFEKSFADERIGAYLALSNWAILFEPELRISLRSLVESFSINKCLMLSLDGDIAKGRYRLMGDEGCTLDLDGLPYLTMA